MILQATPIKLRDGSWGAKVQGDNVLPGTPIRVTAKSGKWWNAVVYKVVWVGDGVAICATVTPEEWQGMYSIMRLAGERHCPECGKDDCPKAVHAFHDCTGIIQYLC